MTDVYDWRGHRLDEPDSREDDIWQAGYRQGLAEGAALRTAASALLDAVMAKHVILSGPPELLAEIDRALDATLPLVQEEA